MSMLNHQVKVEITVNDKLYSSTYRITDAALEIYKNKGVDIIAKEVEKSTKKVMKDILKDRPWNS